MHGAPEMRLQTQPTRLTSTIAARSASLERQVHRSPWPSIFSGETVMASILVPLSFCCFAGVALYAGLVRPVLVRAGLID
jgi:hypothetical protein